MIKQRIENILNKEEIQKIKNDFNKAKNKFATKIITKDNKFVVVDLSEELKKNDIIFFQENNNIEKAVIVCKGKNGVTCRDSKQEKLKIRYSNILNWKHR